MANSLIVLIIGKYKYLHKNAKNFSAITPFLLNRNSYSINRFSLGFSCSVAGRQDLIDRLGCCLA